MDYGDFESECLSSNLFSVVHIRENRFSQDAPHRSRRSPRKKLRASRTSASLVIDQLKNDFRRPGDFTPRMRTRRNWRPEFLIKYLRYNRCDEERTVMVRHRERSFVPEIPKICSIGLHFSPRSLNSNDLSNLYGATRNFKRHFDIVLRPMFICEYWIEKSRSLTSTDVSLKTQKNRQTMTIDCTESTNISKHDGIQKNNNCNQSYEHIEEENSNISDILRNDFAAGDRSFISNDFKDSFVMKEYRSCVTRDAQIQTSSRKSSRRRKTHRKHRDHESRGRIITNFHVDSHKSNGKNRNEESRLCIQVLEGRRADYIDKFTAVNRQIEEITATLRETCYDDNNSRNSLEDREEYFSSVSDDAKISMKRESNEVEMKSTIARRRSKKMKRKNKDLKSDIKRIIGESKSDRRKNMPEILHVDNINDELLDSPSIKYSKDIIAFSTNPAIKVNDIFVRDSARAFSIDKTVHPLNSGSKKKAKGRYARQISFEMDLMKNDDKLQEFSTFDKTHVRNNFRVPKDVIEDFGNSEESRYRKKIGEKVGEMAILKDIKKRIDRDFDDRSIEYDTEDFLTVSQKSSNFDRSFYEIEPPMEDVSLRIEESKSTSSIVSGSSPNVADLTETKIRDSISADAISESDISNKNSTLSEYFSCMQFPSMVSFAENEESENRNIISHDSHSNILSNYNYYDCSRSNLNTILDRSYSNSKYIAQYISPNKPIETSNADLFELSIENRESFAKDEICKRIFGNNKRDGKKSLVEKRYTADSTFETSKSSRCICSIDSGVFSSSLIDFCPHESFDDKLKPKRKRRVEKLDGSSPLIVDFNSDSSCTDDTLDRRVNDVVRDLTEKLILCERKMKLRKTGYKARDARYHPRQTLSRTRKFNRSFYDAYCDLLTSPRLSSENDRLLSISTPTLLSLSDSEIEHLNELRC